MTDQLTRNPLELCGVYMKKIICKNKENEFHIQC